MNLKKLTARQLEVLQLMADGLADKEIARAIGVSINTARGHVKSVMRNLRVNNRLKAAVYGIRNGLVK